MSESIIQTHTSSLLERGLLVVVVGGKGERKGGREKGERRELKLGWWRRGEKGMVLGGGPGFRINLYVP